MIRGTHWEDCESNTRIRGKRSCWTGPRWRKTSEHDS